MRSTSSPLAVSMMIAGLTRASCAAQPAADREPVLARQHQVEHHQVVALARELLVHRGGVGHRLDLVAFAAEVAHQQVAQALVVVDDQDAGLQFAHGRQ